MMIKRLKQVRGVRALIDLYKRKHFASRMRGSRLFFPRTIYLETTNFCNAKCIMCPHEKMERKKGYMSWALFKKIIDECKSFEGEGLSFSLHKDGEPLLDPLFFKRIKYIRDKLTKSKVSFITNAVLLNEEKARLLLDSDVDSVTFSVDGASKKTYESIRKGLSYDLLKRNLDKFFKLKENASSKVNVTMQMVVSEENKHEIGGYNDLWKDKVDKVYFKSMHNFLVMATSMKTKALSKKQQRFCEFPFKFLVVYWNGDIGLCCWDYDNIVDLGSVECDKIEDVYNSNKFKLIRGAMCNMECGELVPCKICSQIYGNDMEMDYDL